MCSQVRLYIQVPRYFSEQTTTKRPVDDAMALFVLPDRDTRFAERRPTIHPHCNMTVSNGKYCQFVIIFTKYWGNINTYIPTSNFADRPMPPLNFPAMPAGLSVEIIAKVPSRYYRVPWYFFTILSVAHGGTAQHYDRPYIWVSLWTDPQRGFKNVKRPISV